MQILSEMRGYFHGKRTANAQRTEKTGTVGRERVKASRSSGRTVKDWCKESGIYEQTYYRWQKRLFEMAKQQQERRFAVVTPERMDRVDGIAVTVRIAGIEVDIRSGADAVTVETVLRVKSFQSSSFFRLALSTAAMATSPWDELTARIIWPTITAVWGSCIIDNGLDYTGYTVLLSICAENQKE